jgi:hypothetical protein
MVLVHDLQSFLSSKNNSVLLILYYSGVATSIYGIIGCKLGSLEYRQVAISGGALSPTR